MATGDLPLSGLTTRGTPDRTVDQIYVVNGATQYRSTINNELGITGTPVGTTDSQTLTNKTFTAPTITGPVLSGTVTGTYTLGGTPTFPATVVSTTGTQTLTNKTLTSPTISSPTITNASITADSISGFTVGNTGTIYGVVVTAGGISGASLTANTVPGSALNGTYRFPYQTDNSNTIANVSSTALKIQYGWGQFLGNGTATQTDAVTFPVAFTTILGVTVSWIGFKNSAGAAADITQLGSKIGAGIVIEANSPTTTGFTAGMSSTGVFGAAYHGYSWTAWGI